MFYAGRPSVTALLLLSVVSSGWLQMVHGEDLFTYSDFGLDWNGTCRTGVRQSPINFRETLFSRTAVSPPVPDGTFGTGTNVSVSGYSAPWCLAFTRVRHYSC